MPSSTPPLPETLSSRLLSTIDPQTGACRLHPAVKLCELVQNNTRWVVRRKICYKCGNRSGNGKFHKPGVSVKNGAADVKSRSERRLSGASRTRSVSASRGGSRGLSEDVRARSVSRERSSRRLGGGTRARLSSRDTLMIVPAATSAVAAAPTIHHTVAAVVHPQPTEKEEEQAQEEDFDESDPIIYIPALSPHEELPPPPPRTEEEAERHAERLEMRRVHDATGKKKKSSPIKASVAEHKAVVKSKTHKMDSHPAGIVAHKTATTHKASATAVEQPSMPSAAAMALLESHGKNDNKDRRHVNNINNKSRQRQEEEDQASETSSISTASAKMYQLEPDELHSKHPELAGVDPPHLEPPKQIIPSRNRSISLSRSKKGDQVKKISVDPEEEFALVAVPPPSEPSLLKQSPQARNSRKSMTVVEPQQAKEKTIIQREDRQRRTTVDGRATSKSVVHSKPSSSRISSSKSYAHDTTIKTASSKSVPHSQIKTLSASSARMSRSRCKSRERRRTTTTAVSSRSLANHSHHRSKSRPRSSSRHSHRAKEDHTVHTSKSRSKNTEITVRTQPLSVSSDEERAVATTSGVSKKKEETQQPEVLYKQRASSSRRRPSESGKSAKTMPVTRIDFSDDKSHASSISSSSTIEESFAYSDDEKEGVGNSGDKKKRASMMLKDVKGSAVGLATRGRSTLIGLKGTSKKWQSALFM